jgi:hypothetical protein
VKVYILRYFEDLIEVFATEELAEEAVRLANWGHAIEEWDVREAIPENWESIHKPNYAPEPADPASKALLERAPPYLPHYPGPHKIDIPGTGVPVKWRKKE